MRNTPNSSWHLNCLFAYTTIPDFNCTVITSCNNLTAF
jgi:hypothetical protein